MTVSSRFAGFLLAVGPVLLLAAMIAWAAESAQAQGLSGPGQRLEETVGDGTMAGGGGPGYNAAGGGSGPPVGGGGSGPPVGGGGSGPPVGGGGSGPPVGGGGSGPPGGFAPAGANVPPGGGTGGYGAGGASMGAAPGAAPYVGAAPYGAAPAAAPYGAAPYGAAPYGAAPYGAVVGPNFAANMPMPAYTGGLIAMMRGFDLGPLFASHQVPQVNTGPVLQTEAEVAFQAGNQGLARELMFGHMAAEYQDALVSLQTVKYSPLLRRPVWNIRFGVSMALRSSDGLTDPQPIREGKTPLTGGIVRRPRGGDGGQEMDMAAQMEAEMRNGRGNAGPEADMAMEMDRMATEMAGGTAGGLRPPTLNPGFPQRTMLSQEVGTKLDQSLGLVAEVLASEFNRRFGSGDFGPILTHVVAPVVVVAPAFGGVNPPPVAPTPGMTEALNLALAETGNPLPMWQPGIVFLGEGTPEELLPLAQASQIDFVFHFDVVLKAGRNNSVQNVSRCRLVQVATQKALVLSKSMDSLEAAQLASTGRMGERAYVEEQMSSLFATMDREIKVVELPKLSPEVARGRIAKLIASSSPRSLQTLAEIRLYQARGLIDEKEVEIAFDLVGGVDALLMIHGPHNDRLEKAHQWAVESLNIKPSEG
jgi:hypothetical protein